MPAIIFSRINGSAHRALEASRIFARSAGSLSAARNFAPITGSAHRALAAALYLSRISGVAGDRRLARLGASFNLRIPGKKGAGGGPQPKFEG